MADATSAAAALEARRLELGMTWREVAKAARMTPQHLVRLRNGESQPSPLAASRLATALDWPADRLRRLFGMPPSAIPDDVDLPEPETADPDMSLFRDLVEKVGVNTAFEWLESIRRDESR